MSLAFILYEILSTVAARAKLVLAVARVHTVHSLA